MLTITQLIQESTEITEENIYPIWNQLIMAYKDKFGLDLSDHTFKLSDTPRFTDGRIDHLQEPDSYGGCWTIKKIVYINPNPSRVMKYYHVNNKYKSVSDFLKVIIAHELAHGIYEFKKLPEKEINRLILNAKRKHFSTEYLDTLNKNSPKYSKELFCEYMSYLVCK